MDKHHQAKNPVEVDFLCWTTHPGKYGKSRVISTCTQPTYSSHSAHTSHTMCKYCFTLNNIIFINSFQYKCVCATLEHIQKNK